MRRTTRESGRFGGSGGGGGPGGPGGEARDVGDSDIVLLVENLRRALTDVEQDLQASEAELQRLTARVTHLRQAAAGLRGLVTGRSEQDQLTDSESRSTESTTVPKPDESPAPLKIVPPPVIGSSIPDSFDGVRAILMERPGENVHVDEVRREFRDRGWIRSDWSNPDSAIYAALVRASTRDEHVERTARRTWRYNLRPDGADRSEGGIQEGASQEDIEQ